MNGSRKRFMAYCDTVIIFHHCGYMIPIHTEIGQGTRIHFEKVLNDDGMRSLIPIYLEKEALNFYLNQEVKSEEIYSVNHAEQCLGERRKRTNKVIKGIF